MSDPLRGDLERYERFWPTCDPAQRQRFQRFVQSTPESCQRHHLAGHCTGSAFICCPQWEKTLLLYHPRLARWLQPGGHADGERDLLRVARREASEETGLAWTSLRPYPLFDHPRVPLDLDIHPIPARPGEPAHLHYDLRFLLIADPRETLRPERPEQPVTWLELDKVASLTEERSVLRMVEKVVALREGRIPRLTER